MPPHGMATARYLLDTNIVIYISRQRPPEILERFRRLKHGEAVLSVISYGELRHAIEKSSRRALATRQIVELEGLLPILPMPEKAALHYGLIRAQLERQGETIGNNDLWIASHAKAAGLTLVTNNEREFKRVAGLKVENWVG